MKAGWYAELTRNEKEPGGYVLAHLRLTQLGNTIYSLVMPVLLSLAIDSV
ncbi:hypothetical protein O3W44_20485 [Pantoea sp. LMR881]|nr:hypothetical protein [Pantoea sp. LMR881]MCZ4060944.1 hypothetical protein [Pantoea sp. LMR881]